MTHLSSEQIYEWLKGERHDVVEQHLSNCEKCNHDVLNLKLGLADFRNSVWAPARSSGRVGETTPASRRLSWGWTAFATTAAMTLTILPFYFEARQAQREAERAEDALLLNQVNARLTRAVPGPMEPLMELMIEGKEGTR